MVKRSFSSCVCFLRYKRMKLQHFLPEVGLEEAGVVCGLFTSMNYNFLLCQFIGLTVKLKRI